MGMQVSGGGGWVYKSVLVAAGLGKDGWVGCGVRTGVQTGGVVAGWEYVGAVSV